MSQTATDRSAFDAWFRVMARWEGGYANDPNDRGGETNRGITYRTFQALATRLGIPNTYERFRNLTEADQRLFAAHYWRGVRGDDYDQGIAILVADMWLGGGTY
jgi:type VI secretion system secreted protein VgrG